MAHHFTAEELHDLSNCDVHSFIKQGNFKYALKFIIYVREEFLERSESNKRKEFKIDDIK